MELDNLDGNHRATKKGIKLSCFRVGFTKPLSQFMPSAIRPDEGNHIVNVKTHCVYGAVQLLWLISIGIFDPYSLKEPVVVISHLQNKTRGDHCHKCLIYKEKELQ